MVKIINRKIDEEMKKHLKEKEEHPLLFDAQIEGRG